MVGYWLIRRLILDVVMSLVGFFFWMVLVTAWLGVYTVARTERAEWAEWLIYIVPLGRV